jgi:CHAT domain-containing protein
VELARLVWQPLAKHLPAGTKTLYLAADGDLARVPWAALPVGKERVLLEDYAIAQVPHGTFLLDHLKFPRTFTGPEALLTLGAVDYGEGRWDALPGTQVEIAALTRLAPSAPTTLSGANATPTALALGLGKVRYAHLATHGAFQAEALAAEKKRAALARVARQLGDDSRIVTTLNPLGYVGLVLANGKFMSGLSIVDLPLENLQLVTLSACQTGLGEFTDDGGVQGLQRAFHVAGCPNVVASLWKVNDDATAALMTQFYHELWVNKQPPIEALRTAQLTIYRHPERIPILARERGVRVDKVAALPPGVNLDGKQAAATGKTDTRLWAAFVLSGVGK